jgi:glyoxylase-like metal-dependent hydrolase (beta-lactamase superfamily II)
MTTFREGNLVLTKIGPLGQFNNNAYIIADAASGAALVVDAPAESEKVVAAAKGLDVQRIVVTHRHPDHWAGIEALRAGISAPVFTHELDREPHADQVSGTIGDGEEFAVGALRVRVLHTPGHSPGSCCLVVGNRLISGDTLFPGGPGRTRVPENLAEELASITTKLYTLPEAFVVHPGHGDDTTIAASKAEYAVFAAKQHPPDLCGDVLWLTS